MYEGTLEAIDNLLRCWIGWFDLDSFDHHMIAQTF